MSSPVPEGPLAESPVADRLRRAGFKIVRTSFQAANLKANVVAWAANVDGEIVPWVAVETAISRKAVVPDIALPHLARARDELGTHEHYVVVDDKWFRADRALRSLERVDGPTAPPYGTEGFVTDPSLVESTLRQDLDRKFSSLHSSADPIWEPWPVQIRGWQAGDMATPQSEFFSVGADTLWEAARSVLATYGERQGRLVQHSSNPTVALAVADLLGGAIGGTILDPFCGTGSFLWAVGDRVKTEGVSGVQLVGGELNEQTASIARLVGQVSGLSVDIETGDSFTADLPQSHFIVAAPPLGLRLREPRLLLSGETTRDSDVAAVDLAIERLRPGGRAVLLLARSFATRAERYRQYLVERAWIGAVIATPGGLISGTSIPGLLLVIENTPSNRPAFVAQLGEDDWEAQLTPGGALLEAARRHLDDAAVYSQ